jgi:hypothetical protein
MQIYKTRWLARFARQEHIADKSLLEAIARAERGLIDADLGGGLIKQRVARQGQGRSGGYRMIVAYRAQDRAVFFYGFAKSDRENVEPDVDDAGDCSGVARTRRRPNRRSHSE